MSMQSLGLLIYYACFSLFLGSHCKNTKECRLLCGLPSRF